MKNSITQNKAISILLIAVIIFSLTGCSKNGQVEEKPEAEVSVEAQTVSKNSDSNITSQKTTTRGNTTATVDNSIKEPAAIEEIKFINGPLPLDLKPHDPTSIKAYDFSHNFPTVGPFYGDGWRMQVVEFKGNTAVIDFGNTGSKPLVISNDNVFYEMYGDGGPNIAGPYIVGGPVTIAPNEIKRVTIKAEHQGAKRLYINIKGLDRFLDDMRFNESIKDAKPYTAPKGDAYRRLVTTPEVLSLSTLETVSGNGKFKYMVESINLIANDHIGSFKKPAQPQGAIGLVKVKIANTSNEIMTISKIRQNYVNTGSNANGNIIIQGDVLKALGSNALPATIKPGEIVEGYVPVGFMSSEVVHSIAFDSNLGPFGITTIETFPLGGNS